jgi:hypothetical protein
MAGAAAVGDGPAGAGVAMAGALAAGAAAWEPAGAATVVAVPLVGCVVCSGSAKAGDSGARTVSAAPLTEREVEAGGAKGGWGARTLSALRVAKRAVGAGGAGGGDAGHGPGAPHPAGGVTTGQVFRESHVAAAQGTDAASAGRSRASVAVESSAAVATTPAARRWPFTPTRTGGHGAVPASPGWRQPNGSGRPSPRA